MSDLDDMLDASSQQGAIADMAAGLEAMAPWSNHLAIFAEPLVDTTQKTTQRAKCPPVVVPLPSAVVRGHELVRWQVYPASFAELLTSLDTVPDTKRWSVTRAARQVTGSTADGTEIVLTEADIRSMPVMTAKALLAAVAVYGDLPAQRPPALVGSGDGLSSPIELALGLPAMGTDALYIMVETLEELEDIVSGGTLRSKLGDILALAGCEHIFEDMAPVDGWFLLKEVLPLIEEPGRKALANIREFEMLVGMFDRDIPLSVLRERQADYAAIHNRKIKASNKPPRK